MDKREASIIVFLVLLLIIFLVDYFLVKRRYLKKYLGKKESKKNNELMEISYLVAKFNLDKSKLNMHYLLIEISLINAFIMSTVIVIMLVLNIFILLKLLIGFILLFALIYSMYEILGRRLVKKGMTK